jgi:aminoglycoside phosphotransferase (APT) family kinase protein
MHGKLALALLPTPRRAPNVDDTHWWAPKAQRARLANEFIDVLADLHALDPDSLGLGELGK